MRKPRSDSRLLNLPHHQQDALAAWLLDEGLSYADAKEKLHMDFNVQTSEAALGSFWERVCAPRQFLRVAEASEAAPALAEGLENNFAAVTEAYVRQHYFVLMASRNPDPKLLTCFAEQVGALDRGKLERAKLAFAEHKHAQTQQLKEQDLALQREKFEFDAVKQAISHAAEIKTITGDRTLNSAEQSERVRRLLFPQAFAEEVRTS